MKKSYYRSLWLCLAISFLSIRCDKVKDLVSVNLELQMANIEFSIPPQAQGTQGLAEFSTHLNVDSIIKSKSPSLGVNNIKSVKIKSCTIQLLNASGDDHFGALSAYKVELGSNGNWTIVAEQANNPDAASSTLTVPVNSAEDFKPYFIGSSFAYKLSGTTRRATTQTLACKATIVFDVKAGL